MNRIHLAESTPGQLHRNRLSAFAAVAAAVVLGVALVGGAAVLLNGGPARPGPAAPVVSPSPTSPTAAPTPDSSTSPAPAGTVAVTGTQAGCVSTVEGPETTVDGLQRKRDGVRTCTDTTSDARLSGTATLTFNYDEHADGTWTYWGTSRVTNEGGSWTGLYDGFGPNDSIATMHLYYKGEGGYAGLQYRGTAVLGGADTPLEGTIEPLGPVGVTSSQTCVQTKPGEEGVTAGGLQYTRGTVVACATTASDPRVAGEGTVEMTMEEQPDGSWVYTGSTQLHNAGGSWTGVVGGTSEPNASVAHLVNRALGIGGYAGLTLEMNVSLNSDNTTTMTGTITPTR